jgi:ABC-type glycerol-3-phosphate transport system substrate-binding protein
MAEHKPTDGPDTLETTSDGSKPLITRREAIRLGLIGGAAALAAPTVLSNAAFASTPAVRRVPAASPTTIKLWTWYTQQEQLFPQLAKQFEKLHPNVSVQVRTFGTLDAYYPALQASVSAGETPDVFGPGDLAVTYGLDGIALDLHAALGASYLSDFFESTNLEYSAGSKQFGVGWMAQTFGIYYNPELLKKAKVDVPETWQDVMDAAEPITKAGLIPLGLAAAPSDTAADFFLPLVTQAANDPTLMLKLDALTKPGITWNSKPVIDAFGMLQKLAQAGVFSPSALSTEYNDLEILFYTGKTPLIYGGSWMPPDFLGETTASFNAMYGVAQTPAWKTGAKHWCANQAGAGLSVAAKSPNVDIALEFLKFLYEPARYSATMNASNSMPSTKSAVELVKNPKIRTMTSWLTAGNGCPHILFGVGSTTAAGTAAVDVLQGKLSPQGAAAQTEAQVKQARKV